MYFKVSRVQCIPLRDLFYLLPPITLCSFLAVALLLLFFLFLLPQPADAATILLPAVRHQLGQIEDSKTSSSPFATNHDNDRNNNGNRKKNYSNETDTMTKHGLLDRVATNFCLSTPDLDSDPAARNPSSHNRRTNLPPEPKFHISSKDYFVHPLPGTYPRMIRLSDGSILFAFTHFETSINDNNNHSPSPPVRSLKIAKSIDGGRTFMPHGEVTSSSGDTDNMFLLQLPWAVSSSSPSPGGQGSGDRSGQGQLQHEVQPILAAFRNHDYAPVSPPDNVNSPNPGGRWGYAHHRITICQSLDNGRRWEFLSQAVESSPPFGLWEPFLRMSKSRRGEIQLFYSGELGPDDQDTFLTVSRDGGRSWDRPRAVTGRGETSVLGKKGGQAASRQQQEQQQKQGDTCDGEGNGKLRDGMVGIAETRDRKGREVLVMVLETTRAGGHFVVECLMSYDDGLSWGWRQSVYDPGWCLDGAGRVSRHGSKRKRKNAGAPQIASFGDGEIAVVFMTDEDDDFGAEQQGQGGEDGGQETDRWPMGAKIKVLFGGRPDEDGRIAWREGGTPRDISSLGTVLVELGDGDGKKPTGRVPVSSRVPAPAPGQDTSSFWPGVITLDGDKVLVVYETGGIIKGKVITKG